MENNEKENEVKNENEIKSIKAENLLKVHLLPFSILLSALILSSVLVYTAELKAGSGKKTVKAEAEQGSVLEEKVLPKDGVLLPVKWGDLGAKMQSVGVIDGKQFTALYEQRGGLSEEEKKLLNGENNGQIMMTEKNSGTLLNLFWALGLGTKNNILDSGPMKDSRYGGAGNFASTGGWTLSVGGAMEHYSRHPFTVLTKEQQALVERVSKNIYRPCCNNATYFPDCNHGMAMLGLLELMASQGVGEEEMYRIAMAVNSYWFPDNYLTIAKYMESKGIDWKNINPKEILGKDYSSASGFARVLQQIPQQNTGGGGGGCGVDAGVPAASSKQQGGCGI